MKIKNIITICIVSLMLCPSMSALALPGQNIKALILWTSNHKLLMKLTKVNKYEPDECDFTSKVKIGQAELSYNVWVKNGIVINENLDYRSSSPALQFKKDNVKGINLIKDVYGESISSDFKTATFVESIKIKDVNAHVDFFKGKLYAYMATNDPENQYFSFTPMLLKDLTKSINDFKHPAASSEVY